MVRRTAAQVVLAFTVVLGACTPGAAPMQEGDAATPRDPDTTLAIPIEWLADSARGGTLPIEPPPAVWVARVAPSRPPPPPDPPLPEAMPAVPDAAPPPPALEIDPGLKPPIPRGAVRMAVPDGPRRGPAHVELDVEVGADGAVRDVVWAGGSRDPALVEAAIACASSMEFFPALRGELPVAVWCRQRFDFGR